MKQPKSFEEGMDRLQGLLTQLQDEATPLADSVKLYAEAAGLIEAYNGVRYAGAEPTEAQLSQAQALLKQK